MNNGPRKIFRDTAIKHYIQGRNKDILLSVAPPRALIYLLIFLFLCFIAGFLAWNTRVPVYAPGVGTVVVSAQQGGNRAVVVLFLAPNQLTRVRPGQAVQLQIGATGPQLTRTIMAVEPTVLNPDEVRKHYGLDGILSLIGMQSATVVTVALGLPNASHTYAGNIVQAEVQVGSQNVLSLLR